MDVVHSRYVMLQMEDREKFHEFVEFCEVQSKN